ncbi:hypothetical protein IGI57_001846 [Enterococcus sp. DIV0213j]|jgi:hypothetical protein
MDMARKSVLNADSANERKKVWDFDKSQTLLQTKVFLKNDYLIFMFYFSRPAVKAAF